jgi:hypothetical protein
MTIPNGMSHSGGGWYTPAHPFLTYIMLDLEIFLIIPGQAKTDPPNKMDLAITAEKVSDSFIGSAIPKGCTVDHFGLYL